MKHALIAGAVLAAFLYFLHQRISDQPFSYDEADYMYAAEQGFLANYIDSPSYSFAEFLRIGLSSVRDQGQRSSLFWAVRTEGDVWFYRHTHGPTYFYWLRAVSWWSSNEFFVRSASMIFPLLTGLAVYFGSLWILPGPQGQIAAVVGMAAYLLSPAVTGTGDVTPHHAFTMWSIATLLLLSKLLVEPQRRWWYAALIAFALAFCTLEVAFVLVPVALVCAWLERRKLAVDWQFAVRSVAVPAAIVLLVHPADLFKLSFLKSYLYMAYLAVMRKAAWGEVTLGGTWIQRFTDSPVEWMLIVAAVVAWFRYRDLPGRRAAIPFLLFGLLMVGVMFRVLSTSLRYVLPFLPTLLVFAAFTLSGVLVRWRRPVRVAGAAVLGAALLFNAQRYTLAHPFRTHPRLGQLLVEVRGRGLESKRLLVPQDDLPTLHYYFPQSQLTGYIGDVPNNAGAFDAVVLPGDPLRIQPPD